MSPNRSASDALIIMHFQVDSGLVNFWTAQTGLGRQDVVISGNDWAFRRRLETQNPAGTLPANMITQVKFPFLNFRLKPGGIHSPDSTYVRNWSNTHGRYMAEVFNKRSNTLGDSVIVLPYFADYECTFWCSEYAKAADLFQRIYLSNWDDNLFEYNYIINGEEYAFDASLEFMNLELDPTYAESDVLIKNKIRSVSMDFQVKAFVFTGKNVQTAEGAVLEYFYGGELPGNEATGVDPIDPNRTVEIIP